MIYRCVIYALLIFVQPSSLPAESHGASDARNLFNQAVKYVEKKNYLDAVRIFSDLALQDFAEAQYNLSLFYFNGLGTPINFKQSLYWSWQAHLNEHAAASDRVNAVFDLITDGLRNEVAQQIIDELKLSAESGDKIAPLKMGKTYLGLFVQPDNKAAYLWLSISQAYGDESASELLNKAAEALSVEEILAQQEEARKTFTSIVNEN